jgi:hypothetical protein
MYRPEINYCVKTSGSFIQEIQMKIRIVTETGPQSHFAQKISLQCKNNNTPFSEAKQLMSSTQRRINEHNHYILKSCLTV